MLNNYFLLGLAFAVTKENLIIFGITKDFHKWIKCECGVDYSKSRVNKLIKAALFLNKYKRVLKTTVSINEIIRHLKLMSDAFNEDALLALEWETI